SLKSPGDIANKRFWTTAIDWSNYELIFTGAAKDLFLPALVNSIGICLIATVIAVVLATLTAYAVARLDFPGKKFILTMALAVSIFPVISLVTPLFRIWSAIGLYDTWAGLIIHYLSLTLPISIWTLAAFFRQIPWELE
ncbi:carbohydrate ABC transporter permease, partial [Burkholderia multivorans]|uniref:carbohydrate ABC transporter permease n=1 Tax=Burkholderia multivorans TaxID=87883 RepID=UPI003D346E36